MYVSTFSYLLIAEKKNRTPHLLLDCEHHIIGVLAGRPRDHSWKVVHKDALAALRSAATKMKFTVDEERGRRGSFPTISFGVSYGGGQKVRAC